MNMHHAVFGMNFLFHFISLIIVSLLHSLLILHIPPVHLFHRHHFYHPSLLLFHLMLKITFHDSTGSQRVLLAWNFGTCSMDVDLCISGEFHRGGRQVAYKCKIARDACSSFKHARPQTCMPIPRLLLWISLDYYWGFSPRLYFILLTPGMDFGPSTALSYFFHRSYPPLTAILQPIELITSVNSWLVENFSCATVLCFVYVFVDFFFSFFYSSLD